MPLVRQARAAASLLITTLFLSTGFLSTGFLSTGPVSAAAAADPAPSCRDSGPELRYVVLYAPGTERSAAAGEAASHCGSMAVYYGQIGVGIVDSADPGFASLIGRDRAYSAEEQVRGGLRQRAGEGRRSAQVAHGGSTPQWNLAQLRAEKAHQVTEGNRDVLVGVLDSGIDAAHPELAAAVDTERSANCLTPEDPALSRPPHGNPHGTHVAGIIAAADDGRGVTGVARSSPITAPTAWARWTSPLPGAIRGSARPDACGRPSPGTTARRAAPRWPHRTCPGWRPC